MLMRIQYGEYANKQKGNNFWQFKEPYEISMAWDPNRSTNFFFSPPAHDCTGMYRHIYDWNIIDCAVNQPVHLRERRLSEF